MPTPTPPTSTIKLARLFGIRLLLLMLAVLLVPGCGDGAENPSDPAADYEHVYTVRAEVTQLPDGSPGGGFFAHHEPIPEYISALGTRGMNAMTMPFQIVDGSVLEGIAVGDIVEITFGESFEPEVKQGVISIRKLPSDTELDFGGGREGLDG